MNFEANIGKVVWVIDQNRPTRRVIVEVIKGKVPGLYLVARPGSNFHYVVPHRSVMFTLEEGV